MIRPQLFSILIWLTSVFTTSLFSLCAAVDATALPVKVSSNDPQLQYQGRWTRGKPESHFAWSGSSVSIRFKGTDVNVLLTDKAKGGENKNGGVNNNYFSVIIDGGELFVFHGERDKKVYRIASGLPDGEHDLLLFKRTEASVGVVQFHGFELSEKASVLPPTKFSRKIEFIGDSITCGYGNEAKDETEHFSPLTENNYLAYGALTARAFGADYTCISYSGIGVYTSRGDTKNTILTRYNKILPCDPNAFWDYSQTTTPQVLVINLGTNDFYKDNPGENYERCYLELLKMVRKNYPKTQIFCCLGPMMWGKIVQENKDLIMSAIQKLEDNNITFVEFKSHNKNKSGLGADWHPSIKSHQEMSEVLIKAIEENTDWEKL